MANNSFEISHGLNVNNFLIVNSTAVAVGSNIVINTTALSIGNSTVNAQVNSDSFTLGTFVVNTSQLMVGSNVFVAFNQYQIGNSTVNTAIFQQLVRSQNSSVSTNVTPGGLVSGISVVNSTVVAVGANVFMNATHIVAPSLSTSLGGKQNATANLDGWSALATSAKQNATANLDGWSALATSAKQNTIGYTPVNRAGDTMTGKLVTTGTVGIIASNLGDYGGIEVYGGGGGNAAYITFHRPGAFACYLGLDADNQFKIGGYSYGAASYKLWSEVNDGPGTGLDADTVDGIQGANIVRTVNGTNPDGAGNVTVGGGANVQVFTGSGTWTKPASGTIAIIECWGGGGGGRSVTAQGGGGGGGGYNRSVLRLSVISASQTVTVAAGGAACTAGGSSSFGTFCVAYGGGPGGTAGNGGSGGGPFSVGGTGPGAPGLPIIIADTATGAMHGHGTNGTTGAALPGIFHGGGGGAGLPATPGQPSVYGGGGGGSASGGAGGLSGSGGNGGAGAASGVGTNGSVPGGGGGGSNLSTGGSGGNGMVIVTVI